MTSTTRCGRHQPPPKRGGRFSTNARMPSTKSSSAVQAPKLSASASSWRESVLPSDSLTRRLAFAVASRGPVTSALTSDGGRRVELRRRHDAIDEPERECLLRVEALAQQHDLHRLLDADDARQRVRAAAVRREPDVAIRRCEERIVGGDDEVAGVHQRQAEAGHRAVDAGDDRMRHPLQVLDGGVQPADQRGEARLALGAGQRRASRRTCADRRPP